MKSVTFDTLALAYLDWFLKLAKDQQYVVWKVKKNDPI